MSHDFTGQPNLASRALGAGVVYANDDLFAARENLVTPDPPVHDPGAFGPRGKVYDGWETRRRRTPGNDLAIVRLGVRGAVSGVVVDTAYFVGNYPPRVSVDGVDLAGYPSVGELLGASWQPLVPVSEVKGDATNAFGVEGAPTCTHVRLTLHPDGGVARLRVHGRPVPDPALLSGTIDLAALENGGDVVDCSDAFYASARNLLMPGRAHTTADGWVTLLPRGEVQPDTRQVLRVEGDAATTPVDHVRLDVFPDGGLARLRVLGELCP